MNVLTPNPDSTVGLTDFNNPKSDYIGKFNPVLLKEWVEMILDTFGDDYVYLAVHKSEDPTVTARVLTAADEYGDPLQVAVCGMEDDDEIKKGGKK